MAISAPSKPPSTKERFVATACQLFQSKGYEATSVGEIAKAGELPIGSLYYHFPAGKEELGAAAVSYGADEFIDVLNEGLARSTDPAEALQATLLYLADRLEADQWAEGCPIAVVALETVNHSPILQTATAQALDRWVAVVAARLVELDINPDDAHEIATVFIALLEGAELMARVAGSRAPLEAAGRRMAGLVHGGRS